jgi:hypothetical protein
MIPSFPIDIDRSARISCATIAAQGCPGLKKYDTQHEQRQSNSLLVRTDAQVCR